jgi:hypothetical protein
MYYDLYDDLRTKTYKSLDDLKFKLIKSFDLEGK